MGRDSVGRAAQVLELDSASDELMSLSYTCDVVKWLEQKFSMYGIRDEFYRSEGVWGQKSGMLAVPRLVLWT